MDFPDSIELLKKYFKPAQDGRIIRGSCDWELTVILVHYSRPDRVEVYRTESSFEGVAGTWDTVSWLEREEMARGLRTKMTPGLDDDEEED